MLIEWKITHSKPDWKSGLLYAITGSLYDDKGHEITEVIEEDIEEEHLPFVKDGIRDDLIDAAQKYIRGQEIIEMYSEPEELDVT